MSNTKTEPNHDFDAFMERLPQWAQSHVRELQTEIRTLRSRLEVQRTASKLVNADADIFLAHVTPYPEPDIGLNGPNMVRPELRKYVGIRFGGTDDHPYEGLQVQWRDRDQHRDAEFGKHWVELRGDDITVKPSSSNTIYVGWGRE